MISCVLIRDESDKEEQIWVRKVLLLICCDVERRKRAVKSHLYSLCSLCCLWMLYTMLRDACVCGEELYRVKEGNLKWLVGENDCSVAEK